jgi:hypothetical protein
MPAPAELTSHQTPALLVEALVEAHPDRGRTRLRAAPLDLLQLVEGCAQSVAVLMGAQARAGGGGRARGMLVGLKDAEVLAQAEPGEVLYATVERLHELPPFAIWRAEVASAGGTPLARVEVKTMALAAEAAP